MTDDNRAVLAVIMVIIIIFAFLAGGMVGSGSKGLEFQKEAVQKGFAEYNQVTGEWQWKGK